MHRMSLFCLLFLFFLKACQGTKAPLSVSGATTPPLTLKVFTNKTKIEMGEDFYYTLEVIAEKKFKIEFPPFGGSLQKEFAIRDIRTPPPEDLGRFFRYQQIYTLNAYQIAPYTLEPAIIRYALKPSAENPSTTGSTSEIPEEEEEEEASLVWKEMKSSEIFIEILSPLKFDDKGNILESSEDIEEIEEVQPLPLPQKSLPLLEIGLGGGAVLLFLLYLLLRKRPAEKVPPPPPAHIVALRELQRIQSLNLVPQEAYKEYYNRVSFCLRTYLENRFALKAPERTTPEFVEEMVRTSVLSDSQKEKLREFLQHCDLVKFAKSIPNASQCEAIFHTVQEFVEETKTTEIWQDNSEDEDEDDDKNEDESEEDEEESKKNEENQGL
jgi:hypothetical protein